jgi:hypothetical protein
MPVCLKFGRNNGFSSDATPDFGKLPVYFSKIGNGSTPMTDLAVSALTDVILACMMFFLAGLSFNGVTRGTAACSWAVTMVLMGASSMLGAIDHGFYESINHPAHGTLLIVTRWVIVLASLGMLISTARQFLPRGWRKVVLGLGVVGALVTMVGIALSENFLIVIASYSVVLLLTLGLHLAGLRSGRGSWEMCAAILVSIGASLMGPLGYTGPEWLGLYGTYHVVLMPAGILFYLAGRRLDRSVLPHR